MKLLLPPCLITITHDTQSRFFNWTQKLCYLFLSCIQAGLIVLICMCAAISFAHAQTISLRGTTTATFKAPDIGFRGAGEVGTRNGGNIRPTNGLSLPTGTAAGDILICVYEARDNISPSMPSGWVALNNADNGGSRAAVFWKRAAAGETAPTITRANGGIAIARIIGFYNVNPVTTFDVANSFTATATASNAVTADTVATVTDNTMLVFTAHIADNWSGLTAPSPSLSPPWTASFFSQTATGGGVAVGAWHGLQASTGIQPQITSTRTSGAAAAVNNGAQIALRQATVNTTLTINTPSGTALDDVMIASITVKPQTATITAPSGWSLVRRTDNANGTGESLAIFLKIAGAAEPASYDWTLGGVYSAAGSMMSFINVDTTTPIDVENAATTAATSLTQSTPSVTTTVGDTLILSMHTLMSSANWTPPNTMTEVADIFSEPSASPAGVALSNNYVSQTAIATVGPFTATASSNGDYGISQVLALRPRVHHFAISLTNSPDTCTPATLTITAQDKDNNTVTNYTGTVNLSTSFSHGDWAAGTPAPAGTLNNGTGDDGAASYAFSLSDAGVIRLTLTNIHDDDLTVTVVDNTRNSTSSVSGTIQFRGNFFQIANDPIQIAGRPQAMTATLKQGASCLNTLTVYPNGNHALKAWFTTDADHPSGAISPVMAGASPAITTSVPAANNVTLNFTSGVAPFTLNTTDIGKYVINLRDDSQAFATNAINGTSSTITTRPFALVVSDIKQGAVNNPSGTATTGGKFVAAGDTFQATVGAYLWNSAADTNVVGGDGVPDATATLAQITGSGSVPSYTWSTTLSAAAPFTPLGPFTLSNGALSGACPTNTPLCFTNGIATPNTLSYPEVGSFTLIATATNFLNSGITLNGIVFDNSATPARNAVVGRFYPDHFTLTAGGVSAACASGFTYMGQPNFGYSFIIEARNKADNLVSNYSTGSYSVGTVSMLAENNNNGTDLSARLPAPTASWSGGSYSFNSSAITFSRLAAPDGPYDALQIGVKVVDSDGPVLAFRDMDPATSTVCTSLTCTGRSIGSTTKMRFGRLRTANASGSELLPLPMFLRAEYWNNNGFVKNNDDFCTQILVPIVGSGLAFYPITAKNQLPSGGTTASINATSVGSGTLSPASDYQLRLSAPGAGKYGYVDVQLNAPAWLQYGGHPRTARATFGKSKTGPIIFMREMY